MIDWYVVSWIPIASFPQQAGLEEDFRTTEAFGVQRDDVSIWEFVGLSTITCVGCWLMSDPRIVTPATKSGVLTDVDPKIFRAVSGEGLSQWIICVYIYISEIL